MYLENVEKEMLDTNAVHIGEKFGPVKQLEIVGVYGKTNVGYNLIYIVQCNVCKQDSELFGEGYFTSTHSNLRMGKLPCNCAVNYRLTENQAFTKAQRKASELGYIFNGFVGGKFEGSSTKLELVCPTHGNYTSTQYNVFVNRDIGCRKCAGISRGEKRQITETEMLSRIEDICKGKGYTLKGWKGDCIDGNSYLKLHCPEHGIWETTSCYSLIYNKTSCPKCVDEETARKSVKPFQEHIDKLIATGIYDVTKDYSRSDKRDSKGHKPFWNVYCNSCKSFREILLSNLKAGKYSCDCVGIKCRYNYIMSVKDGGELIGLKFGISKDPIRRLSDLKSNNTFDIEILFIYEYETEQLCRTAEQVCKKSFDCGIFSRLDFKDGNSETTYVKNLDKMIEIFENYGGIKQNRM